MSRRLSWPIWADFGQARDAQNGGKMAELSAKMGPRWRQDGPRSGLGGHLEATWGAILAISRRLGNDLCREARSIKSNTSKRFLVDFRIQGGPVGGSWIPFWAILASS